MISFTSDYCDSSDYLLSCPNGLLVDSGITYRSEPVVTSFFLTFYWILLYSSKIFDAVVVLDLFDNLIFYLGLTFSLIISDVSDNSLGSDTGSTTFGGWVQTNNSNGSNF